MNLLFPFLSIFRLANALGTTIFVAQIAWWCIKKYNELYRNNKLNSDIKKEFNKEFFEHFHRIPSKDEIDVVLKTLNKVNHPLKAKITEFFKSF